MANDASIADLVRKTANDAKRLVQAQVAFTQAELKSTGEAVAITSGLAIATVIIVSLFAIFILITIAFALAAMGLPTWAGFGLVSLFLLIAAIVTGILTKKNASSIKGPDLSMAELRKTQETLAPSKP
ncbi:MAG: hypothetical protein RL205_429, partial [Actinomycetota bacterium]